MSEKGERISKFLSHAGICSRRDAERYIEAGRIHVNGTLVTHPATLVTKTDSIAVDGQVVAGKAPTELWLYHKPAGLVTTHKDPEGRPTLFERLPEGLPRLISVGRLDLNSEGLLLLTNDGELSRYLELPANGWARRYRVRLDGKPSVETLRQLKRGVTIDDMRYLPVDVTLEKEKESGRNQWVEVCLKEGKNREIRRLFEHFGHPVSRLIRVSYGPFQLGNLGAGEVRKVSRTALKNAIGKGFAL